MVTKSNSRIQRSLVGLGLASKSKSGSFPFPTVQEEVLAKPDSGPLAPVPRPEVIACPEVRIIPLSILRLLDVAVNTPLEIP